MSALRAFLVALKMPQHELTMLGAGFDDVVTFATFDDVDVQTMDETLLTAGIPPGHLKRIMDTVRACQDKELRLKRGSSPLKFDYGKQMPLLHKTSATRFARSRSRCTNGAARRTSVSS